MANFYFFTFNVLFLACTIFGDKSFFILQASVELNWRISKCAFSYAYNKNDNCLFDSVETTFCQKKTKRKQKRNKNKKQHKNKKNESKIDSQMYVYCTMFKS